jgi:predicted outer membrane lipoprotein
MECKELHTNKHCKKCLHYCTDGEFWCRCYNSFSVDEWDSLITTPEGYLNWDNYNKYDRQGEKLPCFEKMHKPRISLILKTFGIWAFGTALWSFILLSLTYLFSDEIPLLIKILLVLLACAFSIGGALHQYGLDRNKKTKSEMDEYMLWWNF